MFRSVLTQQTRSFAAKAAKEVAAKAPVKATKATAVKATKEAAPKATKAAATKVAAKPTPAKATKAAAAATPAKAVKATATKATATKATATKKVADKVKVDKVVAKKEVTPKVVKEKKEIVPKVVKVPADFRAKLKTRTQTDVAPISERAKLYAERRQKFEEQFKTTLERMNKLVQNPKYSQETLQRYKTRTEKLQVKIDRAHNWFRKAQRKASKEQRLANMPPNAKMQAMNQEDRLNTILKIDTGINSGYQLFARELKILKGQLPFDAYLNGWKGAKQDLYNRLTKAARPSRDV